MLGVSFYQELWSTLVLSRSAIVFMLSDQMHSTHCLARIRRCVDRTHSGVHRSHFHFEDQPVSSFTHARRPVFGQWSRLHSGSVTCGTSRLTLPTSPLSRTFILHRAIVSVVDKRQLRVHAVCCH